MIRNLVVIKKDRLPRINKNARVFVDIDKGGGGRVSESISTSALEY